MKKLIIGCMIAGLALGAVAEGSFSYQGMLTMADGSASTVKMPTITFRIYDSPTDTTVLWGKTYSVSLASDGLFTVELTDASGTGAEGSYKDNLNGLFSEKGDAGLYIGLTVQGSTGEITPRQKMTPVPVSSFARNVRKASGEFNCVGKATFESAAEVDGTLEVKGTLTAAKLSVTDTTTLGGSLTLSGTTKVTGDLQGSDGKAMIPKGTIWMWYGNTSDIPKGWAICDGSNGTPDLRGRFVVGVGKSDNGDTTYALGDKGGEEKHKLTVDEMPSHNHAQDAYRDNDSYKSDGAIDWRVVESRFWGNAQSRSETTTYFKGGDKEHENRPPYYALYYIMKL